MKGAVDLGLVQGLLSTRTLLPAAAATPNAVHHSFHLKWYAVAVDAHGNRRHFCGSPLGNRSATPRQFAGKGRQSAYVCLQNADQLPVVCRLLAAKMPTLCRSGNRGKIRQSG